MNLGKTKHRFADIVAECSQRSGSDPDAVASALAGLERERKRAQHEIDQYTTRRLSVNQRTGLIRKLERLYDEAVAAVRSAHGSESAPFDAMYRSAFEAVGLPVTEADGVAADEIPGFLPASMHHYYRVVGRHPVNVAHNRLVAPGDLRIESGRLVFMVENQDVAEWCVEDLAVDDPPVLQGVRHPDGSFDWYPEDLGFSEFMVAMVRWTVTGEEPDR